ncbi:VOC family protein [Alkalihalobacterium chitinilyticum]|uniref:VOC family protein n=1 Tax=Alkalihalobacterium chitinilyticum TaxID=2980103 RepID=A0ABT5VF42_9BACI|nr:VOC family protein [Alkalihalobacterium chitinilyticum]MDE5414079.1 VOC family protein [Alkalihalobacterium chitinilyticum]
MNFHQNPITYVAQVNLKVAQLQRAITFYKEVLGFRVMNQTDQTAHLSADGQTTLVTLEQIEGAIPKTYPTTGLYHFALLLPTRADLANIVNHLLQKGVRFASSDHLVSEALYLSDPDGNGIEIYADRNHSEWNWRGGEVEMTVDPLDFSDLHAEAGEKHWTRLPSDTVMGHIHLHVSNLVETEQFYREGLGFDVVCRYGDQALFMSSGGYHHHIGLNTWAGVGAPSPKEKQVGLKAFSIQFPNEAARNKVVDQLRQMGASVSQEGEFYQTKDPSDNHIKLEVS